MIRAAAVRARRAPGCRPRAGNGPPRPDAARRTPCAPRSPHRL